MAAVPMSPSRPHNGRQRVGEDPTDARDPDGPLTGMNDQSIAEKSDK